MRAVSVVGYMSVTLHVKKCDFTEIVSPGVVNVVSSAHGSLHVERGGRYYVRFSEWGRSPEKSLHGRDHSIHACSPTLARTLSL